MELQGQVEGIIYQNEANSYTIANLDTDNEEITIVGYLPFIREGDTLRVIGNYVEHKDYGTQFKVSTFEKIMPENLEALEKYLASGAIKGVGEATAKRIIKTFGNETIDIIKNQPEKLSNVKGISEEKAQKISEDFLENQEMWKIVGFLEKFHIGAQHAKKVYEKFGVSSIEKIKEDPYLLIEIARGVDFRQIDEMAIRIGITPDNDRRVQTGIKYGLIRSTYNGNSCVLEINLIEYVQSLLDVSSETIEDNLIALKIKGEIVYDFRENEQWVYLARFFDTEKEIAYRLRKLEQSKNVKEIKNVESALKKIEKESDIELSEKQKEAIEEINNNNVLIITGGPGTGKTTIIKTIIELYENRGKKVILAAPTGRAAKKMTEATGKEASTLHRLLCIGKLDDEGIYQSHDEFQGEPIDADVVVIDELSMVDMFVMNYLLKCVYQGTKLVLVGDIDQLPSVGPGSVLKDLIESETIKTVHLDKIFRQAAKSKIILNAHRVNKGETFLGKEDIETETNQDFFYIKHNTQEEILKEVISLCTGRLEKFGNYDFFQNIQILTPTKKGLLGTKELNKELQMYLNPNLDGRPEKSNSGAIYRTGDRIMQIKNNYDMTWDRENDDGKMEYGEGVFNGEFGTITGISERDKVLEVKFDDNKVAWYEFSELDQIEHSYAITIHKSQGSEFDVVIMVAPTAAPMLLTRNLLYTGITRAKKLLIIIGIDNVVDYMIQNVDSKKRNTGLKQKIIEEFE